MVRLHSLTLIWQLVLEKSNSKVKPVKLYQKLTLCHILLMQRGYIYIYIYIYIRFKFYIYIILGRVIPKTQKIVLDAGLLHTQYYKLRIKGKVERSREGVAPSLTSWCSSYWKWSLWVTFDLGRQHYFIYIYIYILSSTERLFRCITTLQCG